MWSPSWLTTEPEKELGLPGSLFCTLSTQVDSRRFVLQNFLSTLYSAGDKKSYYGCMYPKSLSVKHSPAPHFHPHSWKAMYLHKDTAGTHIGTQQLFFFMTFFFAPRLISLCPQFPFYPCLFTYISLYANT